MFLDRDNLRGLPWMLKPDLEDAPSGHPVLSQHGTIVRRQQGGETTSGQRCFQYVAAGNSL